LPDPLPDVPAEPDVSWESLCSPDPLGLAESEPLGFPDPEPLTDSLPDPDTSCESPEPLCLLDPEPDISCESFGSPELLGLSEPLPESTVSPDPEPLSLGAT